MKRSNRKGLLFLWSLLVLTLGGTYLVGREILFGEEEILPSLWLIGFGILFANVVYLFLISILSIFLKEKPLRETYVNEFPRTALCYFLRNEDTELLYQRMDWSFQGNRLPGLDFWILSDSDAEYEPGELGLVERFRQKYGNRVHYRRRKIPFERKQGNIQDFVHSHPEYSFLYICDADSSVPKGTVLKLLKKALHPANQDIAIFQTLVCTANARTYYARFEGIASETSQKLYFKTLQALFGEAISFGHHLLARREILERIKLPKGLLSHDNWDTARISQMWFRVAFVPDVFAFDEAPANYLEARRREARWAQGTLQGWPLLFLKGLSPGVRFLSFYGIYCYLAQPVFLLWVLAGLISQSYFAGELLSFRTDWLLLGHFVNRTVYLILAFSLLVIFLHKLVIVRTREDLGKFFYELFLSTLVYSGNFFYSTLDLVCLPLRKLIWQPMKKDPFEELNLRKSLKAFLPGTMVGLFGLWYLFEGTPFPRLTALPILISLALGIPIVFFTSKSNLKESVTS